MYLPLKQVKMSDWESHGLLEADVTHPHWWQRNGGKWFTE